LSPSKHGKLGKKQQQKQQQQQQQSLVLWLMNSLFCFAVCDRVGSIFILLLLTSKENADCDEHAAA